MGKNLWDTMGTYYANTVKLTGNQTVSGIKTFNTSTIFLSGFEIPTGKFGIQYSMPTSASHLVNKAYIDDVASLQADNAGACISVTMGTTKKIAVDIATGGALKFTTSTDAGELSVDINGLSNLVTPHNTDELMIWDTVSESFKKITKQNLFGSTATVITFSGIWNPNTNTITGDPLNSSITKDTAPTVEAGYEEVGVMYIVSNYGSFDLNGDTTLEVLYATDWIIWLGTEWGIVTKARVLSSYSMNALDVETVATTALSYGRCMKVMVSAYNSTGDIHSVEVFLNAKNTTDSYMTTYAEIKSNSALFTLESENDATNLNLNLTAVEQITVTSSIIDII